MGHTIEPLLEEFEALQQSECHPWVDLNQQPLSLETIASQGRLPCGNPTDVGAILPIQYQEILHHSTIHSNYKVLSILGLW